jgi:O-antigen ligase
MARPMLSYAPALTRARYRQLPLTLPRSWLVAAMLFFLFTRLSDLYGAVLPALTFNQLIVAILALGILVRAVIPPREMPVWHPLLSLMLLYGGAIALSAISAEDRGATQAQVVVHLREVLIVFVVVNLVTDLRGLRIATWSLIAGATCVAVAALVGGALGSELDGLARVNVGNIAADDAGIRLAGIIGNSNALAQMLVCVAPLAIYRAFDERKLSLRLTALAAFGVLVVAIMWTFSRGGALALGTVVAAAVVMQRRQLVRVGLLLGMLVVVLPAAPRLYWDRAAVTVEYAAAALSPHVTATPEPSAAPAASTEEPSAQSEPAAASEPVATAVPETVSVLAIPAPPQDTGSLDERSRLLRIGMLMFKDHPLLGVGKGNYLLEYPHYFASAYPLLQSEPRVAHSTPVQLLADTGVLGLLSFLLVVGSAVWLLRRAKKTQGGAQFTLLVEPVELGMYGYLVASLFMSDDFPRYLWLLIGLAIVAVRLRAGKALT